MFFIVLVLIMFAKSAGINFPWPCCLIFLWTLAEIHEEALRDRFDILCQ